MSFARSSSYRQRSPDRRGRGLLTAVLATWLATGCRAMVGAPAAGSPPTPAAAVAPIAGADRSGAGGLAASRGAGPGAGVVVGRLIDGVTGLAVPDAGVAILEIGRRTVTAPGGHFRFDGVPTGRFTLVVGPADGFLPRSLDVSVLPDGLNASLIPVVPATPPTLIVPEFGGKVPACGDTQLLLPTAAVGEPTPIQVTCITHAGAFPAPPPAGRLPLAAVDTAPAGTALASPGRLTVDLPSQPRYAAGVTLDLLRLDLHRLIWVPTASLVVDAGGRTATGSVNALGTFLVAAPPFGTFLSATDAGPAITRLNTSSGAQAAPQEVFATGTAVVYLSLDYGGLSDTPLRIRTTNRKGEVVFESTRTVSGSGHDDVPMAHGRSAWPVDAYLTTVDLGTTTEPSSVAWRIAAEPTPRPAPPTLPAIVPPGLQASGAPAAPWPAAPPRSACVPAGAWYAYYVQPGDTLYGLAEYTGIDAGSLARANCLDSLILQAGQVLYVPNPPRAPKPVFPGGPLWSPYAGVKPTLAPPPVAQPAPPIGAGPSQAAPPAGLPAPGMPTPGAPGGGAPAQPGFDPSKGLRGPEPTLAPRPAAPVPPPAAGLPGGASAGGQALPPVPAPRSQPVAPAPVVPPAIVPPAPPPAGGEPGGNKGSRGPEPTLAPRP